MRKPDLISRRWTDSVQLTLQCDPIWQVTLRSSKTGCGDTGQIAFSVERRLQLKHLSSWENCTRFLLATPDNSLSCCGVQLVSGALPRYRLQCRHTLSNLCIYLSAVLFFFFYFFCLFLILVLISLVFVFVAFFFPLQPHDYFPTSVSVHPSSSSLFNSWSLSSSTLGRPNSLSGSHHHGDADDVISEWQLDLKCWKRLAMYW